MGIAPVDDEPKMVGKGGALRAAMTGLTCPMVGVLGVEAPVEGLKRLLLVEAAAAEDTEINGKLGRVGGGGTALGLTS